MDPALLELMDQGQGRDLVSAIIRVQPGEILPPTVSVISDFGTVLTVRLHREDIPAVWSEDVIASLKAPRILAADLAFDISEAEDILPGDPQPWSDLPYNGRGVVIGILDWGLDFAHREFLNEDGSTRLLAMWDQRGPPQPNNRYGYGRIISEQEINAALANPDPYAALGYHPCDADATGQGSHGSHVAGLAAGRTLSPASGARLVFVHLSTYNSGKLTNLGDSVTILEGFDFIRSVSGNNPLVINISAGRHGGPHDGLTLVEQGIDWFVTERPGRAVCQSTGNYFDQNVHASGQLRSGETHRIAFRLDPADRTPNEVEVWYPGRDEFDIRVESPDGSVDLSVPLGESRTLKAGDREIGRLYHRKRDSINKDQHVDLFLYPIGPAGEWSLHLYGKDVVDGRYHAWIERDATCPGCQVHFLPESAAPYYTTGTICNGFHTIAVGAYNPHLEHRPLGIFSSSGPTRDGRLKPNLLAPGVAIRSARSAPRGVEHGGNQFVRMTGTSMASPAVAATVAVMFEAAGRPLSINETRRLLLENAEPRQAPDADRMRAGNGYLDTRKAVLAAAAYPPAATLRMAAPFGEFPSGKELVNMMENESQSEERTIPGTAAEEDSEWYSYIEVERGEWDEPCVEGDCNEPEDAENRPLGNVQFAGATYALRTVSNTPDFQNAQLDEALQYALRQTGQHVCITGSLWTGNNFEAYLCQSLTIPAPPSVIDYNPPGPAAAIVLNGEQVFIPSDPLTGAAATRWVRLSSAREFYGMGQTYIDRQRRFWIDGRGRHRGLNGASQSIQIPGVTVTRSWLQGRSMPELRLLLAHFAAQVYRVFNVNQPADQFLGAEIFGLTLPIIRLPLSEPECYLPVIAEAEGLLEAVNAYDLGAGLSVGPTQFNCIEAHLFYFLKRVWDEDQTLFNSAFGGLNWSMRLHNNHPDLVVNAGTAQEVVMHGLAADRNRNVGYFHSGTPGNHQFNQINSAFRRSLVEGFRALLVWPHIQDLILEIAAQRELAPAMPTIHNQANGIPALNPNPTQTLYNNQLDCDLFVLKTLLCSSYIRYSACLSPFLQALRPWRTAADKLSNWQTALQSQTVSWGNCTPNRRNRLTTRLQNQQTAARQVCQAFRSLLPAPPPPARPPAPGPLPAPGRTPAPAVALAGVREIDEEAGPWLPDQGDLDGALEAIPSPFAAMSTAVQNTSPLARLAGEMLMLEQAYHPKQSMTSRVLVEHVMNITGIGRNPSALLPIGLPPLHALFDAFAHGEGLDGRLADLFQVVGLPGEPPGEPPQMGDLLLRHAENGFGHAAFLFDGELVQTGELSKRRLNAESLSPGWYAQVVEAGLFPHNPSDRFARRVYDSAGRLPADTLLLRLRLPEAAAPYGEHFDIERGLSRALPIGKGMWTEALHGSATPQAMRNRMISSGLAWLAVKLEMRGELGLDGTGRVNPRRVLEDYLQVLREGNAIPNLGIWLWGWSDPLYDPERYASLLVSRTIEVGGQGVIVDAEGPWQSSSPRQAEQKRARASQLMEALLRHARPAGLSLGVTTFTGIAGFPYEEFSRADFGMPQIYEREGRLPQDYPSRSVDALRAAGFQRIIPVSNAFNKNQAEMEDLLRRTPVPSLAISWWVWHAADHDAGRWQAIAGYRIPPLAPPGVLQEAEQAGPLQFVVRNRLIQERVPAARIELLSGVNISASGTTNASGQVSINLSGLADGDYLLRVTHATSTTDPAGPSIASVVPRPDRIWRPMNTTVTVTGGRLTASVSPDVTFQAAIVTLKLQPAWMRSPNARARAAAVRPRTIVVHHTGGATIPGAIHTFLNPNSTSAHYIIDVDGQVLKMVHEDEQAFHAGCSHWGGSNSVNGFSVGIEIVNAGGPYPQEQYTALIDLLGRIRGSYPTIPAAQIPGHSDVGTCEPGNGNCNCPVKRLGRKSTDPGLTFDWRILERAGLGLQVRAGPQPDSIYGGFFRSFPNGALRLNDNDASHRYGGQAVPAITGIIAELQDDLSSIGYYCPSTGTYDTTTHFTVMMFQEHFFAGSRQTMGAPTGNLDWATASMVKSVR